MWTGLVRHGDDGGPAFDDPNVRKAMVLARVGERAAAPDHRGAVAPGMSTQRRPPHCAMFNSAMAGALAPSWTAGISRTWASCACCGPSSPIPTSCLGDGVPSCSCAPAPPGSGDRLVERYSRPSLRRQGHTLAAPDHAGSSLPGREGRSGRPEPVAAQRQAPRPAVSRRQSRSAAAPHARRCPRGVPARLGARERILVRLGVLWRHWLVPTPDGRSPEAAWGFEPALPDDRAALARP